MPMRGFARQMASRQPGFISVRPLAELGGLVEEENPTGIPPNALVQSLNACRKGRMTGTRPGLNLGDASYDDEIGSGLSNFQGGYDYRYGQNANRELLVVVGGNVYRAHDGTAMTKGTGVQITTGQNNYWTFASFQDKVFMAGGANTDTVNYWDGSGSPGTLNRIALGFDAKYVFEKWNFLFLGGMNGTTYDDNALVGRYCDYATDATDAANWPSANSIPGQLLGENSGPGSRGLEYNTGFGSYQDNRGDFLLMLTNRRLLAFGQNPNLTSSADAFVHVDTVDTGCVHQNAFVNLGLDVGDAVYVSQDGIHSLSQSQEFGNKVTEYLSWPIRRTFDEINRSRMKYVSGAYWPLEGLVTFLFSTGSATSHSLILCLDIKNEKRISPDTVRWSKWQLSGFTPNLLFAARDETTEKPYIYAGGTDGSGIYLGRFQRNVYSDLGGAIETRIQTRNEEFGIISREKRVGDTYVAMQGSGNYKVQHTYVLDDGERFGQSSLLDVPEGGAVWGSGVWGAMNWGGNESTIRNQVVGVDASVTIGHLFTHTGVDEPFWVGALDQEVFISGGTFDDAPNTVA